ncbi:MAG: RluA family pseudouridine synthase [Clostridia bacterium]
MRKLVVNKKYDGKKLNTFLLDSFDGLSLNTIYKALRKKDIRVNNVKVTENVIVHFNDEIALFINDEFLFKDFVLDIVYEDSNILIVNKPIGIEVVSSNSEKTLTNILKEKYSFVEPCHRLDRNTTGLVIFAKNKDALDVILDKFKSLEIEKHYKCTVYGIPKKNQETLIAYLFKDTKKSMVYISNEPKTGYKKIITSYKVLKSNKDNNTSILDVTLHTGRTHQIRAHLAYIGYPIIGDR